MNRRLALAGLVALTGCGFELRHERPRVLLAIVLDVEHGAVARNRLATLIGRGPVGDGLDVTDDLRHDEGPPSATSVRDRALMERPDLRAVRAAQARSVSELRMLPSGPTKRRSCMSWRRVWPQVPRRSASCVSTRTLRAAMEN